MRASAARRAPIWTEEEYLAFENDSPTKHEFYDGEVRAMAGAKLEHNEVCANVIAELRNLTRGGACRVFNSDQRIHIPSARLKYTYPDAGVRCAAPLYAPKAPDGGRSLVNPSVLVEVLSPSTEKYDRGEKLLNYLQIESLMDVLLIEVEHHLVEHHHRGPRGWKHTSRRRGAIPLLGGVVRVDDLY